MSQLHFAQLSDTHIRKDYSVGLLSGMFTSLLSPDEKSARQKADCSLPKQSSYCSIARSGWHLP